MATLAKYHNGRHAYLDLVQSVMFDGVKRSPRGLETFDLGHVTIELDSPYNALPLGMGRGLNTAIAAAEAVQLVAAHADHELLPRISPSFAKFLEPDTKRFYGAYGDRIGTQIAHVVRKLSDDPDTRQAVVTLWDPVMDNFGNHRDFPCTVALNFALIDDKLELRTQMRSNDVWLGLPYDIFQFTQLQLTVARALGKPPGPYTHSTWSLHLYATDAVRATQVTRPASASPYQPTGFGADGESWHTCRQAATHILLGKAVSDRVLTPSERWYREQLKPYRTPA